MYNCLLRLGFTSVEVEVTRALVRIENRSRNRNHKFDGVGVGRTEAIPSPYDSIVMTPSLRDQVKTSLSEGLEHLRLQQIISFH